MSTRTAKRDSTGRERVLIAGGGIAGLETALALRDLAGERLRVEVRDPREDLVFKPFSVGAPYGAARVLRQDLRQLAARSGAVFTPGSIASVDGERRLALSHDGQEISYDYLVLACGVRLLWSVPGAVTFWGGGSEKPVLDAVRDLRAGRLRRVVFTMPGGCSWALPVYELALFAAAELAKPKSAAGDDARVIVVTPEDAPLQIFGNPASEQVSELLAERGVEVRSGAHPVEFENGRLRTAPGDEIEADIVISLPRLEGRRIPGVPHDPDGFIAVDQSGRVRGMERVFAAGDVTAFPVKQGGIATQQADAVAEALAHEAGCEVTPVPFDPVLRGVLWTGESPRYLYARITGGHGEASMLSDSPLWPDSETKVIGKYLTPFVASKAEFGSAAPARAQSA